MERNAQRRQITLATVVPVALIIALVIIVGAIQYPAQGTPPPPVTPIGGFPTPTPLAIMPPPINPTPTSVAEVVDTPAPPPPAAETDTPAPPPPAAETDTPTPPPPAAETNTPVPPPAETATPAPQGGEQLYTFVSGDTLSSVASKFGVTLAAIMVANNLTHPFDVKPGQQVKIPPTDFHPTEVKHRVLPGENLTGIAALYGADPAAIVTRNGLTNPNQVFAGQELIIPLK